MKQGRPLDILKYQNEEARKRARDLRIYFEDNGMNLDMIMTDEEIKKFKVKRRGNK